MVTLFLDLDGTLIDPKPGITASIRHALSEMGAEVPDPEELTWCIGPPLRDSFAILLGEGADVELAVEHYRERYGDEGLFEADLYDGIGEMFEDLAALGVDLWITTSKAQVFAERIADHFGLSSHVRGLFGSELDGSRSDKSELIAHALSATETAPERALLLGDRRFDIDGARNNEIVSIGATWGYAEPGELHLAEADALASQPEDVPEIIIDVMGLDDEDAHYPDRDA